MDAIISTHNLLTNMIQISLISLAYKSTHIIIYISVHLLQE